MLLIASMQVWIHLMSPTKSANYAHTYLIFRLTVGITGHFHWYMVPQFYIMIKQ